jgi:hypothetical protein
MADQVPEDDDFLPRVHDITVVQEDSDDDDDDSSQSSEEL